MMFIPSAVLIAAILLVLLAWRGRRVDDHPLCRRCGYDLGNLDAPVRCPECGRDLGEPRALRHGHRRRRPVAMALGVLLLVTSGAWLGIQIAQRAAGFDLNPHKPEWWLLHDASGSDFAVADKAIDEVNRRFVAGTLSDDAIRRAVESALRVQADRGAQWDPQWGDLIDAAWIKGLLSDEQKAQYVANAFDASLSIRDRVVETDHWIVSLQVHGLRSGELEQLNLVPRLKSLVVNGQSIPLPSHGAAYRVGIGYGGSSTMGLVPHWRAQPGRQDVVAVFEFTAVMFPNGFGGVGAYQGEAPDPESSVAVERTLTTSFEVLPAGTELVTTYTDPSLVDAIRQAIRAPDLNVTSQSAESTTLNVMLYFEGLRFDAAFDVFLARDGREWRVGDVAVSGDPSGLSSHGFGFGTTLNGFNGDTVSLILRSSTAAARRVPGITSIWNGEVVIEDLPINRPDEGAGETQGR